ncbi:hypothetical protein OBV_p-00280 (plasmid) [Oscillibacter valericigenes Sjm18-20]|nr:hypothetical protein OBV_p-00280 [Oscillibacter valericigenes Sjm18-20]
MVKSNEIRFVSEEEKKKMQEYIDKHVENEKKRDAAKDKAFHAAKYVLYTPLSIATHIVACAFKFAGYITSIGLPYGLYCIYKTLIQLKAGVPFAEIKQTTFVCLFVILPFAAFALNLIFDKVSEYFSFHR